MPLKLRYFLLLLMLCLFGLLLTVLLEILQHSKQQKKELLKVKVLENASYTKTDRNCRLNSCFNYFDCPVDNNWNIKVYIYPEVKYQTEEGEEVFPKHSNEFLDIIQALKSSRFWTNDAKEACLFIPNIDLLSEKRVFREYASKTLHSLKYWKKGQNHVLFNFFQEKSSSANPLTINTGQAIVASGDFNLLNFRQKFDVSIPILNTLINTDDFVLKENEIKSVRKRKWLLTVTDGVVEKPVKLELDRLIGTNSKNVLRLSYCKDLEIKYSIYKRCSPGYDHKYPDVLKQSDFCMIISSYGMWKTFLSDALMSGCIPVIIQDFPMPFLTILDWKRASITINQNQIEDLVTILNAIDGNQRVLLRKQGVFLWRQYFSSLSRAVLTTIEILNDGIFPHVAKSYTDWNSELRSYSNGKFNQGMWPSFFVPLSPKTNNGFTAIILTYNRVQMLFDLMQKLSKCPSFAKIIIVWNNPGKSPPPSTSWPKINKPWSIIRSKRNRLSNRFFPYDEIQTEAILSIDDDISMLTVTEVEFAFKVWMEYRDRLVGFPARYHMQDQATLIDKMQYHSNWSNDISMVLTGVAFYHKIYNHMFIKKMPVSVLEYIDDKMNCEDIAMNFLVANLTNKAPIKVTARKRFICNQCTSNESLWSETSFAKRTKCLEVFSKLFGKMPLQTVEFRADPVLFKEDIPVELQEFPDTGMV